MLQNPSPSHYYYIFIGKKLKNKTYSDFKYLLLISVNIFDSFRFIRFSIIVIELKYDIIINIFNFFLRILYKQLSTYLYLIKLEDRTRVFLHQISFSLPSLFLCNNYFQDIF